MSLRRVSMLAKRFFVTKNQIMTLLKKSEKNCPVPKKHQKGTVWSSLSLHFQVETSQERHMSVLYLKLKK